MYMACHAMQHNNTTLVPLSCQALASDVQVGLYMTPARVCDVRSILACHAATQAYAAEVVDAGGQPEHAAGCSSAALAAQLPQEPSWFSAQLRQHSSPPSCPPLPSSLQGGGTSVLADRHSRVAGSEQLSPNPSGTPQPPASSTAGWAMDTGGSSRRGTAGFQSRQALRAVALLGPHAFFGEDALLDVDGRVAGQHQVRAGLAPAASGPEFVPC